MFSHTLNSLSPSHTLSLALPLTVSHPPSPFHSHLLCSHTPFFILTLTLIHFLTLSHTHCHSITFLLLHTFSLTHARFQCLTHFLTPSFFRTHIHLFSNEHIVSITLIFHSVRHTFLLSQTNTVAHSLSHTHIFSLMFLLYHSLTHTKTSFNFLPHTHTFLLSHTFTPNTFLTLSLTERTQQWWERLLREWP